jgi:hypothetical protein
MDTEKELTSGSAFIPGNVIVRGSFSASAFDGTSAFTLIA